MILNGPNLNLLGKREPHIYGKRSYADLVKTLRAKARKLGVEVAIFQSNHEGELIDFLQKEGPGSLGIVIMGRFYAITGPYSRSSDHSQASPRSILWKIATTMRPLSSRTARQCGSLPVSPFSYVRPVSKYCAPGT